MLSTVGVFGGDVSGGSKCPERDAIVALDANWGRGRCDSKKNFTGDSSAPWELSTAFGFASWNVLSAVTLLRDSFETSTKLECDCYSIYATVVDDLAHTEWQIHAVSSLFVIHL